MNVVLQSLDSLLLWAALILGGVCLLIYAVAGMVHEVRRLRRPAVTRLKSGRASRRSSPRSGPGQPRGRPYA